MDPSSTYPSFVINTPVGFIGAGMALAVGWTVWPGAHWFIGVLVFLLVFGLLLSKGPEIGQQLAAVVGWTGHKEKI